MLLGAGVKAEAVASDGTHECALHLVADVRRALLDVALRRGIHPDAVCRMNRLAVAAVVTDALRAGVVA